MKKNKGRNMFTDYYKTNREVEKANDELGKSEENKTAAKKWSTTEKIMLGISLVCILGIIVKYVILR